MEETVTTKTPKRSRRGGVEPVFTRRQLLKAETMAAQVPHCQYRL